MMIGVNSLVDKGRIFYPGVELKTLMMVIRREMRMERSRRRREVGLSFRATEVPGGGVIGSGGGLGGVEGPEPNTGFLPRVSDLSREFPPGSLSHAPEPDLARSVGFSGAAGIILRGHSELRMCSATPHRPNQELVKEKKIRSFSLPIERKQIDISNKRHG